MKKIQHNSGSEAKKEKVAVVASKRTSKKPVKASKQQVVEEEDDEDGDEDVEDSDENEEDEEPAPKPRKRNAAKEKKKLHSGKKGSATRGKSLKGKLQRSAKKQQEKTDEKLDRKEKREKQQKSNKKKDSKKLTRTQEGHIIQRVIQSGALNVRQIVEKTGFSEARVQSHLKYEEERGRIEYDKKGRVLVNDENQPNYRTE